MKKRNDVTNNFYQILLEEKQSICGLTKEFNKDEQLIIFPLTNVSADINMVNGNIVSLQKHHITVPNAICMDDAKYNSAFHYTVHYVNDNDTYIARVYFSRYGKYKFISVEENGKKIQLHSLEISCIISNAHVQIFPFFQGIKKIISDKINILIML